MAEVTVYHNPRCSKSRAALELVRGAGVEPRVVEYLKTPPTAEELDDILKMLGLEPRELMRKGEKEYAELKRDDPRLSRAQLIRAMVEHPILIERPIAVKGKKAVVGRPPEKVKDLL
jgi:arsenate reductase (glutaredoxin)